MKSGLIIAVVFAVFAIQGSVFGRPQDAERGLIEDFKQALEKLAQIIKEIAENVVNQFEQLIEELKIKALRLLAAAVASVAEQIIGIVANLKVLIEKAKEMEIDVKECVGGKIDEIESLPEKVIASGKECVAKTVDNAKDIVDDTLQVIENYKKMIQEFEGRWNECDGVGCKIGLIVEATGMTIFLPGEISIQVKRAVELIKNLDDEMVVCLDSTLSLAIEEAKRISEEVTVCIEDKINNVNKINHV